MRKITTRLFIARQGLAVSKGLSLHIGLNGVDPNQYAGWPGTLAGCLNDANAMQAICGSRGFTTQMLFNGNATGDAILSAIGQAAFTLGSGDTFVISYSGHGGQVPDTTGTSPNGLDDTWVAYDRMLLGHELYNLWGQFAPNVRIEVYSDSCHSGTVIRELITSNGTVTFPSSKSRALPELGSNLGTQKFKNVFAAAAKAAPPPPAPAAGGVIRAIPPAVALEVFQRDRDRYEAAQWSRQRGSISASVILISGCQDNQVAQDGQNNGLFTEKLLTVWDSGRFSGTLPQFHQAIVALMPSTQTPNYFTVGVSDPVFTASLPLTILQQSGAATSGQGGAATSGGQTDTGTTAASSSALADAEQATNTAALDQSIRDFFDYVQSVPAGRVIAAYVFARKHGIVALLQSSQPFLDAIGSLLRLAADLDHQLRTGAALTVPDQAWPAIELVTQNLKTMNQDTW